MKPFPIPVRALGPGSQIEEEELNYLPLPQGMATYAPPVLPEPEHLGTRPGAKAALAAIRAALYRFTTGELTANETARVDLSHLDSDDRTLINQVLGEGEVAAQVTGAHAVRIQESVFAGAWRVIVLDGETVLADWVEVGTIPTAIAAAAQCGKPLTEPTQVPPDVMNAPAILTELADQVRNYRTGCAAYVVNLSLLPLALGDVSFLDAQLGRGDVTILSRGYGNCRITTTGVPNCWRVTYYNSQDRVILDTIEIAAVPEVACAAIEDLVDSCDRLGEVIDWIDQR
ncbi:MAG: hydrogenase expression/formation protein [Pseudomonadota bacterium]